VSGPDTVKQLLGAAVVVDVVVVLLVVVDVVVVAVVELEVVDVVVLEHVSVVQTCCPSELQTQVLHSTVLSCPGVQLLEVLEVVLEVVGAVVVEVVEVEVESHDAGQVPSLPAT